MVEQITEPCWAKVNDTLTTKQLDALRHESVILHLRKGSQEIVNCYCDVADPYNPNIDRYRVKWHGENRNVEWKSEDNVIYTGWQLEYEEETIAHIEDIPEDEYYTKQIAKLEYRIENLKRIHDMDQDRLHKTSDYEIQTRFRHEVTGIARNLVDIISIICQDKRVTTILEHFKDFVTNHPANNMDE